MENIKKIIKIGSYHIIFPNGEHYIGSAYGKKGFEGRWDAHKKGDRDSPKYLQELANEYGGWNKVQFIILEETKTKGEALKSEQRFINQYWTDDYKDPLLLNKRRFVMEPPDMFGKNGPIFRKPITEETRQKMRENTSAKRPEVQRKIRENHADVSGKNNPMFGKHHTEETKQKMRENQPDQSGKNSPMFGKHHTEKAKQKMRESQSGDKSNSAKLTWGEVREIRKKYKTGNYTCITLGIEYKISPMTISRITSNKSWKEHP